MHETLAYLSAYVQGPDGFMLDAIYLIGTLAFFALMVAYVRACEALGTADPSAGANTRGQDGR
jgi:hypothetical protein